MAQNLMMRIGNEAMKIFLKSPFHKLFSGNLLLVTVTGHKSGKTYTTPVNYIQVEQIVYVTSKKGRTWWKNLRGGAEAVLRLRGKNIKTATEVLEDEPEVAARLAVYLENATQYARYFGVSLDANGKINLEDVAKAAHNRVLILFQLPHQGQGI